MDQPSDGVVGFWSTHDNDIFPHLDTMMAFDSIPYSDDDLQDTDSNPQPVSALDENLQTIICDPFLDQLLEEFKQSVLPDELDELLPYAEPHVGFPAFEDTVAELARDETIPTPTTDFQNQDDGTATGPSLGYNYNQNEELMLDTCKTLEKEPNDDNSGSVDMDSYEQNIFVTSQPPKYDRRRFLSEKKRRTKRLNATPFTIDISNLRNYTPSVDESLCIRLTLTTAGIELLEPVYIHADALTIYDGNSMRSTTDGSLRIQISKADVDRGYIRFRDLAIIKRKLNKYDLKPIRYSSEEIVQIPDLYEIDSSKTIVGNAKRFRKRFNMNQSQIQCQLLVERGGMLHFTCIQCATHVMIENETKEKTVSSFKTKATKSSRTQVAKSTKCRRTTD